jgi:signal transduction histidine kinase
MRAAIEDLRAADPEAIELLASALVTNSVKHSAISEGDVVDVMLFRDAAGAVRVEVADDGPGFDPDVVPGFGLKALDRTPHRVLG